MAWVRASARCVLARPPTHGHVLDHVEQVLHVRLIRPARELQRRDVVDLFELIQRGLGVEPGLQEFVVARRELGHVGDRDVVVWVHPRTVPVGPRNTRCVAAMSRKLRTDVVTVARLRTNVAGFVSGASSRRITSHPLVPSG